MNVFAEVAPMTEDALAQEKEKSARSPRAPVKILEWAPVQIPAKATRPRPQHLVFEVLIL